jgi:hypothetical protein
LQQRGALTHRATSIAAPRTPIGPQALLIGLEDVQWDVTLVVVWNEHCPVAHWQLDLGLLQMTSGIEPTLDLRSSIAVHASVGRIGQHAMHRPKGSASPVDRNLVDPPMR